MVDHPRLSEAERAQLRIWREWAQFVYLGGGLATIPDDDAAMRAAVCAAHDAEADELRAELAESTDNIRVLLAETDALRAELAQEREQTARQRAAYSGTIERAEGIAAKLADAERRIAALRGFVFHDADCSLRVFGNSVDDSACSCGLAALLSAESPR